MDAMKLCWLHSISRTVNLSVIVSEANPHRVILEMHWFWYHICIGKNAGKGSTFRQQIDFTTQKNTPNVGVLKIAKSEILIPGHKTLRSLRRSSPENFENKKLRLYSDPLKLTTRLGMKMPHKLSSSCSFKSNFHSWLQPAFFSPHLWWMRSVFVASKIPKINLSER